MNEESGEPVLNETVKTLKLHLENPLNEADLVKSLTTLVEECNKTVPHRVQAAKLGALEIILKIINAELSQSHPENSVLHHCILAANSITNKQPDVFDDKCLKLILKLIDTQKDPGVLSDTLRWIQKSCVMHENNRQMIMNEDVLVTHLKPLLSIEDPKIIREVCACFRLLILDDDLRVEFGKAHEHAKAIAIETFPVLTELMSSNFKFINNFTNFLKTYISQTCFRV